MDVAALARQGEDLCHALAQGHEVMPEVLQLLAAFAGTDMVAWSHIQLDAPGTQVLQHPPLDRWHAVEDAYQAAIVLDRTPTELTLISLWRATRDFTQTELETVERLAAAVTDSLRLHEHLCQLRALGEAPGPARLTERQTQVVTLVALGLTNEQIARRLGLSPRTVRKHIECLFARTGASSRTQLAVRWRDSVRAGLPLVPSG